jgi:hypothetical protein
MYLHIPSWRPPLFGEMSARFCGWRVPHVRRGGSLRPCTRFSGPEPLVFLPGGSSVVLAGLGGPVSDSLVLEGSGCAENRTRTFGWWAGGLTAREVCFLLHSMYGLGSYLTGSTVYLCSVARGSDRWTGEAVCFLLHGINGFGSCFAGGTMHLRSVAAGPQRRTFITNKFVN